MTHDHTIDDSPADDTPSPRPRRKTPKPPAIEISHQDEHLFVVNKPAGMWPKHAMLDEPGVFETLCAMDGVDEASLANVYPIEPDVSGLMLLARDDATRKALEAQYADERLTLTYQAIVRALVQTEVGTLDQPLHTPQQGSARVHVDEAHGLPAVTQWRLTDSFVGFALLECTPRTRYPCQIRAHLQNVGMPLAVDHTFGGADSLLLSSFKANYRRSHRRPEKPLIQRPTLHAWRLTFKHPVTEEAMQFEAPPPKDLRATLHQLDRFGRVPKRA